MKYAWNFWDYLTDSIGTCLKNGLDLRDDFCFDKPSFLKWFLADYFVFSFYSILLLVAINIIFLSIILYVPLDRIIFDPLINLFLWKFRVIKRLLLKIKGLG